VISRCVPSTKLWREVTMRAQPGGSRGATCAASRALSMTSSARFPCSNGSEGASQRGRILGQCIRGAEGLEHQRHELLGGGRDRIQAAGV